MWEAHVQLRPDVWTLGNRLYLKVHFVTFWQKKKKLDICEYVTFWWLSDCVGAFTFHHSGLCDVSESIVLGCRTTTLPETRKKQFILEHYVFTLHHISCDGK